MTTGDASSASAKTAVLVLGAPRSGTSALSHLLSELGVYFGDEKDFLDPIIHGHNPVFFELKRLNALNERVLGELGHEYGAFDYFPAASEGAHEYSVELLAEARELILGELGGRRLIGLKDPRFCFTLPFWRQVLSKMGYDVRPVLTVRPERAIVRSNQKVNKYPPLYSRRLTWVSTGAAAINLKGEVFAPVAYDQLVEAPDAVAHRLAAWLGLSAANTDHASKVIRREFRHEASSGEQPDAEIGEIAGNYLDVRNRLESLGILNLVDERRAQVAERDRLISAQSVRIAELTTAYEPRFVREQLDSSARMLEHVNAKIEWQSGALGGLGDFMRDQVEAELQAQERLGAKVQWQSEALASFGDYLRQQVDSNRLAQEQLHGEIARLNALSAERARQADSEGAALRSQVQELRQELAQREAELEQGRLGREEVADLRLKLESSTHARLHAERRAAGFLERIEDLTAQTDEAHRLARPQHDAVNLRADGLPEPSKDKRAGTKIP